MLLLLRASAKVEFLKGLYILASYRHENLRILASKVEASYILASMPLPPWRQPKQQPANPKAQPLYRLPFLHRKEKGFGLHTKPILHT